MCSRWSVASRSHRHCLFIRGFEHQPGRLPTSISFDRLFDAQIYWAIVRVTWPIAELRIVQQQILSQVLDVSNVRNWLIVQLMWEHIWGGFISLSIHYWPSRPIKFYAFLRAIAITESSKIITSMHMLPPCQKPRSTSRTEWLLSSREPPPLFSWWYHPSWLHNPSNCKMLHSNASVTIHSVLFLLIRHTYSPSMVTVAVSGGR